MSVLITRDDGIIDDVAIERALLGFPVPLRPAELREAIVRGEKLGLSIGEVAFRLRVSSRLIDRKRALMAAAS